ncbi:unnamed protein product [Vitrella brassicaformis CCMP3155]|uniref:Uncharacterized protein n=2 Tax=Vitrella brassicaformis TaxID=1169539 RepID=A0A0G4F2K4_VITBC|nr:unnamed protein product [Vitrella brassicaformis CCMP3155]|eukprot:CEM05779.1 unnamed protein product [Vitrella brassicaformis CCMP3155]
MAVLLAQTSLLQRKAADRPVARSFHDKPSPCEPKATTSISQVCCRMSSSVEQPAGPTGGRSVFCMPVHKDLSVCLSVSVGVANGNGATVLRRQEVSSPTTASGQGGGADVFFRLPSGVFYQVVRQGSGPKPTRDQTVKYDLIEWRDDFDGQRKKYDLGGLEGRVSWQQEWLQEVFTDMRVGEVRRVLVPFNRLSSRGTLSLVRYIQYSLVAIL